MRIALIGAAASMALVSATAIGVAQTPGGTEPGKGGQGPGAQTPGKAVGPRSPGAGETQRAPDATPGKGTRESQGAAGKDQPRASQGQTDKGQPKASQPQPEKSQPKASERQPEKGQPKASERQPEKGQPKATERQPDGSQKSTQGRQQAGPVQVSEEQRRGVRERLFKEGRFNKTKLDVSVRVGTRVPPAVRLLPLPAAIIGFAPVYRGYQYIVLEDETICIVEPRSHVIVDVIPAGTQRAERSRSLSLSQEQMRFIAASVPREQRADVRVRLALGAEVARDVELLSFPREVVSQVPDLEGYRYIVADNDIVIVEPRERGVVLVITD